MRKNKGFTLMEILIVVAVIAILIAIAIPVLSAHLEKVRKATCEANLTSCIHLLYMQEMTDGGKLTAGQTGTVTSTLKKGMDADWQTGDLYKKTTGKALCPDGGKYSFVFDKDGHFMTGYCTVHGKPGSLGDADVLAALKKALDDSVAARWTNIIDSGAMDVAGSTAAILKEKLKAAGIDLDKLGAKSWQYNAGTKSFYWSMQDISTKNVKDKFMVIKYNYTNGLYSIWIPSVTQTTFNNTSTYNTQNGEGSGVNAFNKQSDADKTFENALAFYLRNYENADCLNKGKCQ